MKFDFKILLLLTIVLSSKEVFADETSQTTTANAAVAETPTKKKTKAPAAPQKNEEPLAKQLTLEGILPEEKSQIIRMAKQSGAAAAEFEGNELKIYGAGFDQDAFDTKLSDTIPGAKIK